MNGIIVVDKPAGFTSFDVVAKMRGICGTRKIGHGGTLDPMATGVLPVFIGRAAKAVDLAPNQGKAYSATIRFGIATDTGDITGEILSRSDKSVSQEELMAVLPLFTGTQSQTPPMYSAVKINGKPLYKYAREGKTVERKQREITIYTIEYGGKVNKNCYNIEVDCSKGTYIRTLVEDIGARLGVPATLEALRRTKSGVFTLPEAVGLDVIQQAKGEGRLEALLRPVGDLFKEMPPVQVGEEAFFRLKNGAVVYDIPAPQGPCALYYLGQFVGLGEGRQDGTLHGTKLFCDDIAQ